MKKFFSLFAIAALLLHAQHSFGASQSEFVPNVQTINIRGIYKGFIQKNPALRDDEELMKAQSHLKSAIDEFAVLGINTEIIPAETANNDDIPDGYYETPHLHVRGPSFFGVLRFAAEGIFDLSSDVIIPYAEYHIPKLFILARTKNRKNNNLQAVVLQNPHAAPHVPSLASKTASIVLKFFGDRPITATIGALR